MWITIARQPVVIKRSLEKGQHKRLTCTHRQFVTSTQ